MIDIDNNGFIDITSSRDSTEIREILQNKNLLKEKDSIYSNTSSGKVLPGKEGMILGSTPDIYGFATLVDSSVEGGLNFTARNSKKATNFDNNFPKQTITSSTAIGGYVYVNFLNGSHNSIITYQFIISIEGQEVMLTPKTFLKEKAFFDGYFQINLMEGKNKEQYPYNSHERYYIKNGNYFEPVSISRTEFENESAFVRYGFLYTARYYSIFGIFERVSNIKKLIRVDLREHGIYGVYQREINSSSSPEEWEEITSWTIKYVRIK